MKTQEEIEQLSKIIVPTPMEGTSYVDVRYGFIQGYTQCQEDMSDNKYTEEDVINIVNKSRETGLTAEYLILQLNKQD